jgi:endonuclease/exonuclease/phosphatase family metal-dependent hydrolase
MEDKIKPVSATIATYNIRNTTDRYDERRELLKQTILEAKADIMGLQEVAFGKGGQLEDLTTTSFGIELYDQYNAETQMKFHELHELQPDFRIDGNSFIVSKEFGNNTGKILKHEKLHLGGCRLVHRMLVEFANNIKVWIVNCHLHHIIEHSIIRQFQAHDICTWMESALRDSDNVILMGDFNTPPHEPAYATFKKFGFQSAYMTIHSEEPKKTFPTGLKAPFMDTDPDGTFDYIFYKGDNVKPLAIEIFGDKAKHDDETIYPSDHYGLVANFEFSI